MHADRLGEIVRPAVMKVWGSGSADAPERRRAKIGRSRLAFDNAVGQIGAHVVEQQIGVGMDVRSVTQLGFGLAGQPQRRLVTLGAADLAEDPFTGLGAPVDLRLSRRRAE